MLAWALHNAFRQPYKEAVMTLSTRFQTPDEIRFSIQSLVADNELDQANELATEGLSSFPESEGVLAITGLLAVVRQEWEKAVTLLERLIAIQGDRASEFTMTMYERALVCSGKALPAERQDSAGAADR